MALVSVVGITALLRLPPSVELVFAGRLRAIAVLVLSSVIAGASEAVLFALSARTVLALAQSARSVTISFGEIRGELRIETMFALMLALALVRILLQTLNAFLPAKLVAEVFSDLQTTIVTKFLNADWSLQARMRTGTFQDILTNQASRVATVVHHGAMAISAATIFVSLIGSAFLVGRWIAFVIVITAGALVLGLRPLLNRGRRIAHQYAAAGQRLAELSSEVSHIGEEIYVLGVAGNASQPLLTEISRVKRLLFKGQFGIQLVSTAYSGLVGLILVVGLFAVYASGATGVAELGGAVLILVRALAYGQQAQAAYAQVSDAAPFVERVQFAIRSFDEHRRADSGVAESRMTSFELSSVSFAYENTERTGVRGLSLRFSKGSRVGVVGVSGAGKSTLVQLLLGLRAPTEGTYLVDGVAQSSILPRVWTRSVAYVAQDTRVVSGTVRDNIVFFRDYITTEQVERAARLASIHDEIMSWPDGYNRQIGQRLDALSGGQRQRLCLARALAGSPSLLVLDEPTSGLDVHSELLVQRTIDSLTNTAVVIVAHRLSTIARCDQLVVMRNGEIECAGSPMEVKARSDFFRHIERAEHAVNSHGGAVKPDPVDTQRSAK
jgi:ATP-binding cassette subfamily B protein